MCSFMYLLQLQTKKLVEFTCEDYPSYVHMFICLCNCLLVADL